jgi:hypothetical protein
VPVSYYGFAGEGSVLIMVNLYKSLDLAEELEGLVAMKRLKTFGPPKKFGKKYAKTFKYAIAKELAQKLDSTSDDDGVILERLAGIR